ncbi:MAG: GntR family transcriptional regulator [Clostridiaceae bacterium]|nr:GntR family transcriptional regulator [Clostridiaceae bacterium]
MTDQREESGLLYLRLLEQIRGEILSGERQPGEKLPSIRDSAAGYGVSTGTVRHVYSLLTREGLIKMETGRGTFVAEPAQELDLSGRKEKALIAIDGAIRALSELGFSTREIEIFFELRLRQKEDATRPLRLAIVAATPEERSIISRSLMHVRHTRIDRIPFSDLVAQPQRLASGFDLLVAPARLGPELEKLAVPPVPVMPVAITISRDTLLACRSIPRKSRVGVLTVSRDFSSVLKDEFGQVLIQGTTLEFGLFGDLEKTRRFIERHEVIVLSPDYANLVGTGEVALFRGELVAEKTLIRTVFDCDQGSLLYLNHAIEKKYQELREFLLD